GDFFVNFYQRETFILLDNLLKGYDRKLRPDLESVLSVLILKSDLIVSKYNNIIFSVRINKQC
ncbi:hypothetical protein Avbf_16168, partial [Armadillidium vulgare]